eukprot:5183975-Amphidinium_carterae.2
MIRRVRSHFGSSYHWISRGDWVTLLGRAQAGERFKDMTQPEPTLSQILSVCQNTNATVCALDTRITSVETKLRNVDTLQTQMDYVLNQLQRFGIAAPTSSSSRRENDDMDTAAPSNVVTPCMSRRSSLDDGSRPAKSARFAESAPSSRRTSVSSKPDSEQQGGLDPQVTLEANGWAPKTPRATVVQELKKSLPQGAVVFSRYLFPRRVFIKFTSHWETRTFMSQYGIRDAAKTCNIGDKKVYFSRALTREQNWKCFAGRKTKTFLVSKGVPADQIKVDKRHGHVWVDGELVCEPRFDEQKLGVTNSWKDEWNVVEAHASLEAARGRKSG